MKKWTESMALKAINPKHNWKKKFINSNPVLFALYRLLKLGRERVKGAKYWGSRGEFGERGMSLYVDLSPTSKPLINEVITRVGDNKQYKILDLGCNVGRHLNELHKKGIGELYGVDVNQSCEEAMAKYFPELAGDAKCSWQSFEDYLPSVPDNHFDIIYTHGISIEHTSPLCNIEKHLCRITSKYIILVNVSFNRGSYPRSWLENIQKYGFSIVKLLQPEKEWSPESTDNRPHSLVVFQRISD